MNEKRRTFLMGVAAAALTQGGLAIASGTTSKTGARVGGAGKVNLFSVETGEYFDIDRVVKSLDEWRAQLDEEQFYVTRKKGTERAFTGKYWDHKGDGIYRCICCGTDLFDSRTKFKSGTGWPSFWAPVDEANLYVMEDKSFFLIRQELLCTRCDAHLGHVFNDGPKPTGLRYCINSASLVFVPREDGWKG